MNSKSENPTFTPGPWWFAQNESDFAVGAGNDELALVGQTGLQDAASHERNRSNARLIAAAPALYEACVSAMGEIERLSEWLGELGNPVQDCTIDKMQKLMEAILAARGEP